MESSLLVSFLELLLSLFDKLLVFDFSEFAFGMLQNLLLELFHFGLHKLRLFLFPLLGSDDHAGVVVLSKGSPGLLQSIPLFLFLFLLGPDRLLNLLDLFVTLLSGVFLDGELLLLADRPVPELDISQLLLLLLLNGLTLLHHEVLVGLDNDVIIDLAVVLLQIFDLSGSDFLEALGLHGADEFQSFLFLDLFELVEDFLSGDLLLAPLLLLLLELLLPRDVGKSLLLREFSLPDPLDLLLSLLFLHLLLLSLLFLDFFLELFLDLHEDAVSLGSAVSGRLSNTVESFVQLIAESEESFGNLSLSVEAEEAFA